MCELLGIQIIAVLAHNLRKICTHPASENVEYHLHEVLSAVKTTMSEGKGVFKWKDWIENDTVNEAKRLREARKLIIQLHDKDED